MKASYRWIRELIPGLDASPEEIGRRLTHAGIEVEAITEFGEGTKTLVVAEVKAYEPHPSRAKLKLVTINRGVSSTLGGSAPTSGAAPPNPQQRIVCGAPNVPEPGGLVAFAPLGAHLPAVNMTLTPREIGGVISEGMLCSERELGLSAVASKDEDAGILILPKGLAAPGTPLREAMPEVHDYILHLGLTPNRPDALGHIGLAREIAALFNLPWKKPTPKAPARFAEGETVSRHVSVRIDDTERCPQYGAGLVLGVTIGPSPTWLRYRLESLGVRSISNVVDVTNLVLLEYGQPMHAFDLNDVRGSQILVRRATPGEPLKTLDGENRKLDADDLVIADAEGPTALAGIMGGANSEIHANTTRVLLECAYFAPRGVRRTARRHGMHTESSHRFERGVDHGSLEDALAYATTRLTELAGGAAAREPILAGAKIPAREPVRLRAARMNALLGTDVPLPEATDILTRLGFEVRGTHGEGEQAYADVIPPSHRPDIAGEADLVEEVVRVRGLGTVPTVLPALRPQPPRHTFDLSLRVRGAAVSVGLSEAITYGFVSAEEIEALGLPPAPFRLLNPLTQDRSVMRTSLLPGLLEAVRRARRHGVPDVRIFTVGSRFLADPTRAPLADEVPSFAAVLAGYRRSPLQKPVEVDVYDAKGVALEIVERVTHEKADVAHQPEATRAPYLHPRAAGQILVKGRVVGAFGVLHPDVVDKLDLDGSAVLVELDLRALGEVGAARPQYRPIPTLPAATRDVALVVSDEVEAGAVGTAIREAGGELCESVEVFDLFRGGSIPAGHRSLAFHVVYRDPRAATDPEKARTLTDEEVDRRHKSVLETVHARFGATLRA
ncbi:phenylalanine--tRNA ligase subunit beta [Polyangium sorediatum]|uniref:Phenylalanine--tRNA ligase beta subunit n=1 Tax=Polyangium sorediatum TaxID=889274 RepID=A0ABT6P2S7_9BACT|nr:phenylalanine--tRNA ligase subunit beta [Polyangium sorediatum]MDI1434672.1 phenylalanine--tRNA ligase subunit beta [Polyangium sorediatum]